MADFNDHDWMLKQLKEAQHAERDMREKTRECRLFVYQRQGQWEQEWYDRAAGKPRYTFDMTTPIVDQVHGEIEQADFDIRVKPAGGNASKDTAQIYDGLIRNIENISQADKVYGAAARSMIIGGLDGWRVVQKYADDDTFDQDLVVEKINNFDDRVWFDASSERQDRSDSRFCWVMTSLAPEVYKEKFPEGSQQGVGTDRTAHAYYHKADNIMVGEFYFKKPEQRELVLMTNGSVYEVDDDFKAVSDELAAVGVTEVSRRKRDVNRVYVRKFDNGGWLEDEAKETVFRHLPVIPCYGNFEVFENKVIYHGVVEKLLDPQRVMNYSMSREIEEGALAPRAKYWMTKKQAAGHQNTLRTLNTNADPVQFFNPDSENPGVPQQIGGAQINPGLRNISEAMRALMGQTAGMFAANMGDNPGLQSGVAIEKLQNKGDNGTIRWFKAMEVAITHTARVLIDAIPDVYSTERQVRILNEDGSFDMKVLNQNVVDMQTGRVVALNDLSQGVYDVTCSAGPSFKNRQQETVQSMVEAAQVDPSIIALGGDILLQNMTSPGMDLVAARKRQELLRAGAIPEDQLTDEEKQALQAAQQQPQQPDPNTLLAMAEMEKAKADQMAVQLKMQQAQVDAQLKQQAQQIDMMKLQLEADKVGINDQQKQREMMLQLQKMEQDIALTMQEQQRKNADTESTIVNREMQTMGVGLDNAQKAQELANAPENMSDEALFAAVRAGGDE